MTCFGEKYDYEFMRMNDGNPCWDIPCHVSNNVLNQGPCGVPCNVPGNVSSDVPSQVPGDIPCNVPRDVLSNIPGKVRSNVPMYPAVPLVMSPVMSCDKSVSPDIVLLFQVLLFHFFIYAPSS